MHSVAHRNHDAALEHDVIGQGRRCARRRRIGPRTHRRPGAEQTERAGEDGESAAREA